MGDMESVGGISYKMPYRMMKLHKIFEKYIKTIEIELLRVQKLLTNSVSEDKYQLIKANRPIYYYWLIALCLCHKTICRTNQSIQSN